MKEIFEEIIKEAKSGVVVIDNDLFNVGFNTIITNENIIELSKNELPVLKINDYELFLNLLTKYVNKTINNKRKIPNMVFDKNKNTIKIIITSLLTNLSTLDFENPYSFLNNHINFYQNKLLENTLEYSNIESFFSSNLEINNINTSIMMETPYKIDIKFTNNEDSYKLPSIYYGINSKNECFIYSIVNPKNLNNDFQKKIKRKLYKINKGLSVFETSPSAVLSLNIFIELLKIKNIEKIFGVTYLPIRYNSREQVALNVKDENKKNELMNRNQLIQTNVTDKFIKTFEAINELNNNLNLIEIPFNVGDLITYEIKHENNNNNVIIKEINNKIKREL